MSSLTERIDDAFTRPDAGDAIRLVKEAVADEMQVLDPASALASTDFFNHAIHPDFVVEWYDGGVRQERPLYLRFEVAQAHLGTDLVLHDEEKPVFVGLLDHRPELSHHGDVLGSLAEDEVLGDHLLEATESVVDANPQSLIAEASAIDALEGHTREHPSQAVATSALVRAGSGRIDAALGDSLGGALARAFSSAQAGERPEDVIDAMAVLEEFVEPVYADRLTNHLQVLWLGSGGDLDELFGADRLDIETLDDVQLRQVLEHVLTREDAPADSTFGRLGQALDADQFGRLLGNFEGGHFNRFVEANLRRWEVSKARVTWREQSAWGWRLQYEMLTFDAGMASIQVTNRGRKLPRSAQGRGVSRADFTARMAQDSPLELDLTGQETELVLRRRADTSDDIKVRPEQIDALGPLAQIVLRAKLESPQLSPGREDPVGGEVDYQRETVQLDEQVSVAALRAFVGRYFGFGTAPVDPESP